MMKRSGPTIVLVPGSCSADAAWCCIIAELVGAFRCVTTSLPGYGRSAERRPPDDRSIGHLAEAIEAVVHEAQAGAYL